MHKKIRLTHRRRHKNYGMVTGEVFGLKKEWRGGGEEKYGMLTIVTISRKWQWYSEIKSEFFLQDIENTM